MGRARRMPLLVLVLAASVAMLLYDPGEMVDIEARWSRLATSAPGGDCPMPATAPADWTVRLPEGEGGFEGLGRGLGASLADDCDGADCPVRVHVVVDPVWGERPGFFGGFGTARVHMALDWWRPGCEGRSAWRLDLKVDQGRRGRVEVVTRHLGRHIGTFLAGNSWSLPVEPR